MEFTTEIDEHEFIDSIVSGLKITECNESEIDTTVISFPPECINIANIVVTIEKLTREIISSKGVLFSIGEHEFIKNSKRNHIECSDTAIFKKMKMCSLHFNDIRNIPEFFAIHRLNPYVDLFIQQPEVSILDDLEFTTEYKNNDKFLPKLVEELNKFIEGIRNEANSPTFKTTIRNCQRRINDNHKSLMSYINKLFDRHARLLVIRIDFGYRKEDMREYGDFERAIRLEDDIQAKYLQAQADRVHLFNNMRSHELSKHLLGYAWRLEYGSLKGFHYHTFFFLDGSKRRQDVTNAKSIGEYWVNVITKGRGLYYNCNAKKDQYKHCGIGMINDFDTKLRQGLEIAARYLTKQDYYAKMDFNDKDGKKARTFGKGEITKPKSSRGRPRKTRHHQD